MCSSWYGYDVSYVDERGDHTAENYRERQQNTSIPALLNLTICCRSKMQSKELPKLITNFDPKNMKPNKRTMRNWHTR